jgi:bacterioferritin-associated ferredoxin
MYVCCCYAVTEREVRAVIEAGADSVPAVTRACRAGGDCGSCQQHIESMLEEHAEAQEGSSRRLPVLCPPPHVAA